MTATEKIEKLLIEAESFIGKDKTSSDGEFNAWKQSLIRFLEKEYRKGSTTTRTLSSRRYAVLSLDGVSHQEEVERFEKILNNTILDLKKLLEESKEDYEGNLKEKTKTKKETNSVTPQINLNINNSNANTNTNYNDNSITVMSFEDIRDNIKDNTFLDDDSKTELLSKLDEIEELSKSKESKTKKWEKARAIFAFILDKGADIAIMFIPQILKAISGQ